MSEISGERANSTDPTHRERREVTLPEAIDSEFERLKLTLENLLVDNKNFRSGHYLETMPSTATFIRSVLPGWRDALVGAVDKLQGIVRDHLVTFDDRLKADEAVVAAFRDLKSPRGPQDLPPVSAGLAARLHIVEDAEAAVRFAVTSQDTVIVDPYMSACGRFSATPIEYGLTDVDAQVLVMLNAALDRVFEPVGDALKEGEVALHNAIRKGLAVDLLAYASREGAREVETEVARRDQNEARRADGPEAARVFASELYDSFDGFGQIGDHYGTDVLVDLLYLQAAILNGTHIDHESGGYSRILEVLEKMPSSERWLTYVDIKPAEGEAPNAN
ncbi:MULTISPECIES: hypothetical protein [unclassified Burkholderia]|uniref:hypothetical protein n=1 Tax=unclassified Burkholderia TaxID=2613784 RepID=UPI002AB0CC94|nr:MULTISPECIES: hypothetical protein [unclassified Burkholderia]